MLLTLFPRGGRRGGALQKGHQGAGGPPLLQWFLLCLCWQVAVGRRRPQSCSWKPLASPKPAPPLALMVGGRNGRSVLFLLLVTCLGQ